MSGSKSLPKDMAQYLATEVLAMEQLHYRGVDGRVKSQTEIATDLGISQSQYSDMRKGENAGVTALLAMSKKTGKAINDLLGPTAPTYVAYDPQVARIIGSLDKFLTVLGKTHSFGPKSVLGPMLEELRTLIGRSPYQADVPGFSVAHSGTAYAAKAIIPAEDLEPKPKRESTRAKKAS